jgi:hypothetical protein
MHTKPGLTAEIHRLYDEGKSVKEIGREVGLTDSSVRNHLNNGEDCVYIIGLGKKVSIEEYTGEYVKIGHSKSQSTTANTTMRDAKRWLAPWHPFEMGKRIGGATGEKGLHEVLDDGRVHPGHEWFYWAIVRERCLRYFAQQED